ncbi:hypothetical protein CUJ83_05425 [Methanocella sp. CWC-04]|uniref:Zn-ribbon containing protein n=1 Tax=Methanooceanicella nereidis TaxID=2052831 RepID=A0AAP2RBG3_9EURY|nr:Zn-ribbon domain-containing protein [Methanocella sp. CWC-04]MCD1294439.1 hypothetical protein [Methanocella sp. CWC-04]
MPHKCMDCKNIIESGSMDLEKGCPVCGCKKFQYIRPKKEPKKAKQTVAEFVTEAASAEPAPTEAQPEAPPVTPLEDIIDVIKPPSPTKNKNEAADKKSEFDRIDSVRILEKGSYEINLPILLNRKELVMSKEEGNYIVDLPSALKTSKKKRK